MALWNNSVKKSLSVSLHIRVIVLVDGQRCACVLKEEMRETALEPGQVALDLPQNLGGDEVAAPPMRRDNDGLLGPLGGHGAVRDKVGR